MYVYIVFWKCSATFTVCLQMSFCIYLLFDFFTVDVAFFTHDNLATLVFSNLGGKSRQCEEKERNEWEIHF